MSSAISHFRPIIGRFAPSPTGALHAGSLVAALGSYLSARSQHGSWLLRMEDVDGPRCSAASATEILHQLERLGFEWDGEVSYQLANVDAYREALHQLNQTKIVYTCECSRRTLRARNALQTYDGHCRALQHKATPHSAIRIQVPDATFRFYDRIQGEISQNLAQDVGDFVLLRADGYWAYQLAVVVDDAASGVTEIVRGADLLDSTPRQTFLQQTLAYPTPQYAHLPLITNAAGQKLSKQTRATPIAHGDELGDLRRAMAHLSQPVPPEIHHLNEFWSWAIAAWNETKISA